MFDMPFGQFAELLAKFDLGQLVLFPGTYRRD